MDPLTKISNQLLKIEAMLAFQLQKSGTEQSRRPSEKEVVEGSADPNTRIHFRRSWFDEFNEVWAKWAKENNVPVDQ